MLVVEYMGVLLLGHKFLRTFSHQNLLGTPQLLVPIAGEEVPRFFMRAANRAAKKMLFVPILVDRCFYYSAQV